MASRSNRYYRDPALAKSFDNIAAMFAPPSGSDAAGFAAAGLNNLKRQQLSDFYKMATDPNADRGVVDRYGVAAGAFTPNQSYYKIGVDDATSRRGQDVTATTARESNIRDNARQMAQTRYGALGEGQVLPAMPGSVASMYGLPAQEQPQQGIVKLGQNQTATMPDGTTMSGINRPQTMDEWQAAQMERMRQQGTVTDQAVQDVIMGKQAPVTALGPDGKTPVYVAPGTAARMQMPAAAAPSSTPVKRSEGVAVIGDKQVPVTRAPDGMQWQLPDGAPVPDGAKVMDMPRPQGSLTDIGATTANNTEANKRAAEVTRTLNLLDGYEAIIDKNPAVLGLVGLVRGTAQNAAATIQDLTKAFGKDSAAVQDMAAGMRDGLAKVAPGLFDAAIPEAQFLQGALAYALARTENPSGEVSRQAYEAAHARIQGGGLLANQQSAKAQIGAFRKVLQDEIAGINTLRNPGKARTDVSNPNAAPAPSGVETWVRGPDGKLTRAQQ